MSHGPQKILDFTANDTEPLVLLFPGVDITGWTIRLHIGYPVPLVKVASIITTGPNGVAEVAFTSGELMFGRYPSEIEVTKPGAVVLTSEVYVSDIRRQVA